MVISGFICGTSALPRDEDKEYERETRSAGSSPRKSRSKNPYSSRGLDRFSALLTEIEEKRQQVYSKLDPNEISLVRFVYTNDHEFKPIIVKSKPKGNIDTQVEKQPNIDTQVEKQPKIDTTTSHNIKSGPLKKLVSSSSMVHQTRNELTTKKKGKMNLYKWVDPKIYLSVIFILILVFLLVKNNSRSFAIMCTSIGWYHIPSITNNSNCTSNVKMALKKKEFATRKLSDKKIVFSEGTKSFKHHHERVNGGRRTS